MAPLLSPLRLLQLGKKRYAGELCGTALAEGAKKYAGISSLKKFWFKRGRNANSQFYWTIESKAIRGIFLFVHVSIHETIGKRYTHNLSIFYFAKKTRQSFSHLCVPVVEAHPCCEEAGDECGVGGGEPHGGGGAGEAEAAGVDDAKAGRVVALPGGKVVFHQGKKSGCRNNNNNKVVYFSLLHPSFGELLIIFACLGTFC